MERLYRSWELFKRSVSVMFQHKQLLVFPVVIVLLTCCIGVVFITPMIGGFALEGVRDAVAHRRFNPQAVSPLIGLDIVCLYFVSMIAATYFNVAFYHEILEALQGRKVSIMNGLNFARTRWKSILLWSVFAGVIGYLIRALERKFGLVGRMVIGLVGLAWSLACVFVVPVIIVEETTCNPIELLKKSVSTLKKTWGESLAGYVGVAFGSWIVLVGSLMWLAGAAAILILLHAPWLALAAGLGWLAAMSLFSYLMSVANQIFRCALFLYASTGAMPPPFDPEMAALAWRVK